MNMSRLRLLILCPFVMSMMVFAQDAPRTDEEGSSSNITVPSGPALGEAEVIILLQAKVPLDLIQKFVSARGVNFVSTKDTSKRVLAAGGNVALVGTINLNQKDDPPVLDPNGTDKDKKR